MKIRSTRDTWVGRIRTLVQRGHPVEKAALGMIDEMGHMGRGKMTLELTPGTYELFCNVPGRYAGGQHTVFTVTKA